MESIEEDVYSGLVWVEFTIDPRRRWKYFFFFVCLFVLSCFAFLGVSTPPLFKLQIQEVITWAQASLGYSLQQSC